MSPTELQPDPDRIALEHALAGHGPYELFACDPALADTAQFCAAYGFSPDDSVVDANHRVWGIDNLFVVDGSVLPTQGAANPALVIMALADRAAGLLAEKRS